MAENEKNDEMSHHTTDDKIETKEISQVVVEHGTIPLDDLYFDSPGRSISLIKINTLLYINIYLLIGLVD